MPDVFGITSALLSIAANRLASPLRAVGGSTSQDARPPGQNGGSNDQDSVEQGGGPDILLLPDSLKELLDAPLAKLGFPLQRGRIRDTSRRIRNHYRAPVQDGYMAWLYLPNGWIEDSGNATSWAWIGPDFADNGALGLFVLSDGKRVGLSFNMMADKWKGRLQLKEFRFFDSEFEAELTKSDGDDRKAFLQPYIRQFAAPPSPDPTINKISASDKDLLIRMMSAQAVVASVNVKQYFKDLVAATNWPEAFKNQRADVYSGDATSDARGLIDFATAKKENPSIRGYTFLGSLIERLIDDVGATERKQLFEIISNYALVTDQTVINELRGKTQKP